MSTPAKSFEDLRSILGKLDRKIDKARSRRLGIPEEPETTPTEAVSNGEASGEQQTGPQDVVVGEPRRRSPFGRAKPLNRQNPGSENSWIGGGGIG
ncbi:MAG TPA: hypothetical protein ENK11_04550 [Phycisphaerales bacterium]|nr:hypothetical protein [Phycisphaerales bacterium]